jgi:hypothetical protein
LITKVLVSSPPADGAGAATEGTVELEAADNGSVRKEVSSGELDAGNIGGAAANFGSSGFRHIPYSPYYNFTVSYYFRRASLWASAS